MDKMREEFEAWFEADSMPLGSIWLKKDDDDDYARMPTYYAWRAWKASRALLCVQMPRCCNEEQDSYRLNIIDSLDDAGVRHE